MKILFHLETPFSLAHGGIQIQVNRTLQSLKQVGVEADTLRWWDASQRADLIQYFGRFPTYLLNIARQKGIKTVQAELLTEQGSRSRIALNGQRAVIRLLRASVPAENLAPFNWESYRLADACIALTPWEAQLMTRIFGAPPERVHVVPNGVEQIFLNGAREPRGNWLVCTATLTQRKRVLELAEAAVHARTGVWFIGKPYSETDPYYRRFLEISRSHPQFVRYEGEVIDRSQLARIYRAARGFVLLSAMESLSLSALEAAACECPLLLSDLPWARTVFGEGASFCSINWSAAKTGEALKRFHAASPGQTLPPKPLSWLEVAQRLKQIYESLLRTS